MPSPTAGDDEKQLDSPRDPAGRLDDLATVLANYKHHRRRLDYAMDKAKDQAQQARERLQSLPASEPPRRAPPAEPTFGLPASAKQQSPGKFKNPYYHKKLHHCDAGFFVARSLSKT